MTNFEGAVSRRRFFANAAGAGALLGRSRSAFTPRQRGEAHGRYSGAGAGMRLDRLGYQAQLGASSLRVASNADPVSLDPQAAPNAACTSLASAAMSGLLRFRLDADPESSSEHEVEPDLADRWETPDLSYWNLHLRPDARFLAAAPVNGHTVESEDVRASFTRGADAARRAGRARAVQLDSSSIETPDRQTAVIRLPRPYGPLPQLLASVPSGLILPREALAGAYDPSTIMIGSGPFYLASYVPGVTSVLGRNGGYFEQGLPSLEGVQQAVVPSADEQLAQFSASDLDVLRVGHSAMSAASVGNPEAQVIRSISDQNCGIFFQFSGFHPPFLDARLRQAVSEAIDRDAIGQALYAGQYDLAYTVNLSMGPWALHSSGLRSRHGYTFDPADASLLVQAAGYGATGVSLKLAYPAAGIGLDLAAMAKMIADMLSPVFGSVGLLAIDDPGVLGSGGAPLHQGELPQDTLLLAPIYPFQNVDDYLLDYYELLRNPSSLISFQDPYLVAMVDQARAADPVQMQQSYLDVQEYLAGRFFVVNGLPAGYAYTLLQPWVQNYSAVPEAYSEGRAWWTAQIQR